MDEKPKMADKEKEVAKVDLGEEEEEDADREQWGHKMDFILSSVGYAVGLGNVWRFPYLCFKNGGGAFLIPYLIFLAIAGAPLFIMEFSIGQFSSLGCIGCWNVVPLLRGMGIGMVLLSTLVAIYYNVIVAWTIYFMGASCQSTLPWSTCNNSWNTENCFDSSVQNGTFNTSNSVRPSEEYWTYRVHRLTDGIDDMGTMNWDVFGAFLGAWIIVYLCIIKGVKSAGKVVYFTATFPYVVLFILLIRGVTLRGASKGILFYITPKFERLASPEPWKDAANQIFYSLGMSFGSLITFASYNKYKNNCYRDAMMVACINCGTSIFAGFVIFSVLGFMAVDSGLEVEDVVASGPGLAFKVYPEALSRLPVPQLWSILFFFMLLTLGLDSQFAMSEALITAISDELSPAKRKKYKWIVTLGVCVCLFLCGIPMCMKGGLYVFTLMDWYSAYFSLFIISSCYSLSLCYMYGLKRFVSDIRAMIGYDVFIYWQVCWAVLSPLAMMLIVILGFVFYVPAYYGDYVFPDWAQAVGWIMSFVSFLVVPLYSVYAMIFLAEGSFFKRLSFLMKPTWDWGPALNVDRIAHGYKPFPPGRGGRIPEGYTGDYAMESDVTAKYEPTNGVVSIISGRYVPTEQGREADTASNGTPPPDYNSIN
ncbi:sodium- and chloride-dependent glycine transporter 1-like [Lytechinus variegatus]|uniref:sodium- and chloride-dependent glycine transporter 1-like n=1 Tax=Lytechinus variegatus TaxID=7654 RepID=UPI001BB28938|nr:sodium- and chloride-dependent glycine transporter 1-like [Lytechinus variegatus]